MEFLRSGDGLRGMCGLVRPGGFISIGDCEMSLLLSLVSNVMESIDPGRVSSVLRLGLQLEPLLCVPRALEELCLERVGHFTAGVFAARGERVESES